MNNDIVTIKMTKDDFKEVEKTIKLYWAAIEEAYIKAPQDVQDKQINKAIWLFNMLHIENGSMTKEKLLSFPIPSDPENVSDSIDGWKYKIGYVLSISKPNKSGDEVYIEDIVDNLGIDIPEIKVDEEVEEYMNDSLLEEITNKYIEKGVITQSNASRTHVCLYPWRYNIYTHVHSSFGFRSWEYDTVDVRISDEMFCTDTKEVPIIEYLVEEYLKNIKDKKK